jgi:tetratricopeptide (TPR) repeat protein
MPLARGAGALPPPPRVCSTCSEGPEGLLACAACLRVFYCAPPRACQRAHWPAHRPACIAESSARIARREGSLAPMLPLLRSDYDALLAAHGAAAPATLAAADVLGRLLQALGALEEAEAMQQRVLDTLVAASPPAAPLDVLVAQSNLATVLLDRGSLSEATALFRRTLAAKRALLGAEHASTLTGLNNLGHALLQAGRLADAEDAFVEAYEARRRTLGPTDERTLASANNLAEVMRERGRTGEAEALYVQAVDGYKSVLGPEHPRTLTARANLAMLRECARRGGGGGGGPPQPPPRAVPPRPGGFKISRARLALTRPPRVLPPRARPAVWATGRAATALPEAARRRVTAMARAPRGRRDGRPLAPWAP